MPRGRRPSALPPRRQIVGLVLGGVLVVALGIVLSHLRHHLSLPSVLLLYLLAVVVVAAVGGLWAALATAVVSFLVVNWFFTPPLHAFTIGETENLLALFVFLAVATIVSGFVSLAARRAAERSPGRTPRRRFSRRSRASRRSRRCSTGCAPRSGSTAYASGA